MFTLYANSLVNNYLPFPVMISLLVSAVDEAFRTLLDDIFGSDVMEEYRLKRPAGYVDLMNAFESRLILHLFVIKVVE